MIDAKSIARLVNNGATEEQAATRLGISPSRGRQLIALLNLHPKLQKRVGVDLSLDAATKLAKLPQVEQVAKLAEIKATGDKPTARAVTNKLREGSGKAQVETSAQKLKRVYELVFAITNDDRKSWPMTASALVDDIRAIVNPLNQRHYVRKEDEPRKTNRELHPEEFGA